MDDARISDVGSAAGAPADATRRLVAIRSAMAAGALLNVTMAAAYAVQHPEAVRRWPWEMGALSYDFLAAMFAAVGVAAAWIAFSGEIGSLPAGFANLAITLAGIGATILLDGGVLGVPSTVGVGLCVLAAVNVGFWHWSRRLPLAGAPEPLPVVMRVSYGVFTAVLVTVGVALILGVPDVMPWPLARDLSMVFGWIFVGDAWYFASALARPDWRRARAQLWSFLGYDAVLLIPLLLAGPGLPPALRPNVVVYLLVLTYSAALGVSYLLVNPRTRGWGIRHGLATTHGS